MSKKCKWCENPAEVIDYREIDGITSKVPSCGKCVDISTKYLLFLQNNKVLYETAKKVWYDIFTNETLIYNNFEEYFFDELFSKES